MINNEDDGGSWFYPQGKQDGEWTKMAKGGLLAFIIMCVVVGLVSLCVL